MKWCVVGLVQIVLGGVICLSGVLLGGFGFCSPSQQITVFGFGMAVAIAGHALSLKTCVPDKSLASLQTVQAENSDRLAEIHLIVNSQREVMVKTIDELKERVQIMLNEIVALKSQLPLAK